MARPNVGKRNYRSLSVLKYRRGGGAGIKKIHKKLFWAHPTSHRFFRYAPAEEDLYQALFPKTMLSCLVNICVTTIRESDAAAVCRPPNTPEQDSNVRLYKKGISKYILCLSATTANLSLEARSRKIKRKIIRAALGLIRRDKSKIFFLELFARNYIAGVGLCLRRSACR